MTRVWIGINDPAGFDAAVEGGADWVGFVFSPPSPRFVTPDAAASLSARAAGGPPRVGLFVEPTPDIIAAALARVHLDSCRSTARPRTCPPSGPDRSADMARLRNRGGDDFRTARATQTASCSKRAARRSRSARGECGAVRLRILKGWQAPAALASGGRPGTG